MQFSRQRILSTHTGSLPRPADLVAVLNAKELGESYDAGALADRVRRAIVDIVRRQADIGIDVIDDGEHSKVNLTAYARGRLARASRRSTARPAFAARPATRSPFPAPTKMRASCWRRAPQRSCRSARSGRAPWSAPGRSTMSGRTRSRADIENLKAALAAVDAQEAFITAISPTNLELYYENRYYASDEEYLAALADAMHEEYQAIVDAGFLLQIDDPRMATHYDRTPGRLDRGLPEIHRAAGRGRQSRAARHSGRSRAVPHLLQHQRRAARARSRAEALCRPDAARSTPAPI